MALEYRFDHLGNVELQPNGHRRSFCWLYFLLFILVQLGVAAWLYLSGYLTPIDSNNDQARSLRGNMNELERRVEVQDAHILVLESQVATAQRSEKIQSTTNAALRDKLILAETELAESRQRLLLYEEILSPEALDKGLNIQHLGIKQLFIDNQGKKLAHDRYYQYHLVLTNVRSGDNLVKGRFDLQFKGQQKEKSIALKLKEVAVDAAMEKLAEAEKGARFSLKYYQSLEGNFELPEGFQPTQVVVELVPVSGKAGKKVTKQYDWDAFESSKNSTTNKE